VDSRDETALAQALLAGEADAFEHFVEYFRSKIFHYSWMMCGSPDDAEEVAQETLLKVFESIDQLRDPARVRAWVFRIARNVCLMQRRKSVFAPPTLEELPPDANLPAAEEHPGAQYLAAELRDVIDRAVAELPPLYRAVVLLRDREELSTEETAQVLDVPIDVVKTRLHRGRVAIRQKLDCYVHNHCLEGQPSPNPKPLTPDERHDLLSTWRSRLPVT